MAHYLNCISIHIKTKESRKSWNRSGITLPSNEKFGESSALLCQIEKSKIINELLKEEVERLIRLNEEKALSLAFQKASKDKQRLAAIREWEPLDLEEWG